MSFWDTLPQPIIALSPMDGITDHPFRHITKKYGQPQLMYTEFTSVEGVCHGASQLLRDFLYDETQRPILGQVYGTTPQFFRETAIILCELGFDGIDINMGCPAKNVAHSGAGAALICTPKLAQEIIRETKAGIQDYLNGVRARDCEHLVKDIVTEVEKRHAELPAEFQTPRELPVSIKTRIGFDTPVLDMWINNLLEMEPAAIALHGRTLKQQYGGLANWEEIARAAELMKGSKTLLLGNGDITCREDAIEHIETAHTNGALLGRSSMGNPFVFLPKSQWPSREEYFKIAVEHAQLFEDSYKDLPKYNFLPMRKHLGWYVKDIPNASLLRQAIYRTNSTAEFVAVLEEYKKNQQSEVDLPIDAAAALK